MFGEAEVIIKCPKCSRKAIFKSPWTGYKLHPEITGSAFCFSCGYTGRRDLSGKDYYYQIPIGNRVLYAWTLENLIAIKNYFEEGMKNDEPSLDFPKLFYKRREEIIRKINLILKSEPQ